MSSPTSVAIIGSGNIGTDLMFKVMRLSQTLTMGAMVGIDPESDGLARAARLGIPTTHEGVDGLIAMDHFDEIKIVFDATSAKAHLYNAEKLRPYGKHLVDLTPAAIGPFVVPSVNLEEHLDADDINMVTCGGQATIPVVRAITQVADVPYAEIVASIASKSAGPGTRANIDEFTQTTSKAIVDVGGAERGKAIIVLNPAEPPLIMRDTVLALIDGSDEFSHQKIRDSIADMVGQVNQYVPGYRLKQDVQIVPIPEDQPIAGLAGTATVTHQVTVLLEVEGAAHYLPAYAGNLDIMTSAALRAAEKIAERAADRRGEDQE